MAAARNQYLAFNLTSITNESLVLGVPNFVWRQSINIYSNLVCYYLYVDSNKHDNDAKFWGGTEQI
jgi:hypothetical protein